MTEWGVFGVIMTVVGFAGVVYKATQSSNETTRKNNEAIQISNQATQSAIHELSIVIAKLGVIVDNVIIVDAKRDSRLDEHKGILIDYNGRLGEHDKRIEAVEKDIGEIREIRIYRKVYDEPV